jgi:hypothetical protein
MNLPKHVPLLIVFCLFLSACVDTTEKVEKNLDLLTIKAMTLDSMITMETEKLKVIDSVFSSELTKAGKLDSIVTYESRRIDSLINKVQRKVQEKTRQ